MRPPQAHTHTHAHTHTCASAHASHRRTDTGECHQPHAAVLEEIGRRNADHHGSELRHPNQVRADRQGRRCPPAASFKYSPVPANSKYSPVRCGIWSLRLSACAIQTKGRHAPNRTVPHCSHCEPKATLLTTVSGFSARTFAFARHARQADTARQNPTHAHAQTPPCSCHPRPHAPHARARAHTHTHTHTHARAHTHTRPHAPHTYTHAQTHAHTHGLPRPARLCLCRRGGAGAGPFRPPPQGERAYM
jgi:hypothetical protein